jgi:hypothetical protein
MNSDPWEEIAEAFPEIRELPKLSDDDIQRLHDDYIREQIATAQSEQAEKNLQ